MTLVAVEREGRIKWEPIDGIDSAAGRDAERKVAQDEARWRREMEAGAKESRMQEARAHARKEQQRKADLFGAENVYRTTKARGPHVPVPPLLAQTREEEAAARKAGLDKSAPKQYLFIKESLDALEKEHSAKELAAREQAYERNRRRLHVAGKADDEAGADSEDEVEDLRTRLSKMSEEEFKQLAMERKKRAEADLATKDEGKGAGKGAGKPANGSAAAVVDISDGDGRSGGRGGASKGGEGKSGGGGRGGGGKGGASASATPRGGGRPKKNVPLDPADDPDYRR